MCTKIQTANCWQTSKGWKKKKKPKLSAGCPRILTHTTLTPLLSQYLYLWKQPAFRAQPRNGHSSTLEINRGNNEHKRKCWTVRTACSPGSLIWSTQLLLSTAASSSVCCPCTVRLTTTIIPTEPTEAA